MAINLELPKKLQAVIEMTHAGAAEILRPISRKYDQREHAYPVERWYRDLRAIGVAEGVLVI
jgi:acyl-CoA dehydrogenase